MPGGDAFGSRIAIFILMNDASLLSVEEVDFFSSMGASVGEDVPDDSPLDEDTGPPCSEKNEKSDGRLRRLTLLLLLEEVVNGSSKNEKSFDDSSLKFAASVSPVMEPLPIASLAGVVNSSRRVRSPGSSGVALR